MESRLWLQVLIVGIGGFVGAVARYGLSAWTHKATGHDWPAGTLVVNAVGCLLIGAVLYAALERGHLSATTRLLIVTGFLGSLTTFSTFGHETIDLLRQGRGGAAMGNVLANVAIGLAAVAIGWGGAQMALGPNVEDLTEQKAEAGVPKNQFTAERIRVGATEYAYRLFTPEIDVPEQGLPCIVFLHGASQSGTDNASQLSNGLPVEVLKDPGAWPFVVIAPQKPVVRSEWEDHARAVQKMLIGAVESGLVDPDRIAITGLSQGGHGAWSIACRYPGVFRALMPVAGYVNPRVTLPDGSSEYAKRFDTGSPLVGEILETCLDLPIKIIHGGADSVVPASESEGIARMLSRLGGQPELTIYRGVGHNSWDRAYATPGLSEWFERVTAPIEEPIEDDESGD